MNGSEVSAQQPSSNNSNILRNGYKPIQFSKDYVGGITALYVLIMFVSVFGYALIYTAFYINSRLRMICNYFILSLGVADTLVLCSVLPTSIYILLEGETIYGNSIVLCDFFASLNLIASSAVVLNLCSLSLERFIAVVCPFKYKVFMTKGKIIAFIMSLWIYSTLTGLLPQMGWRDIETTFLSGRCVRDMVRGYVFFLTVANFCVPAVIMVTSNIWVYFIASKQVKKIFKLTPNLTSAELNLQERRAKYTRCEKVKLNAKAARRVSVIVGAFLICWLPHIGVIITGLTMGPTGHHKIPYEVYPITLSLQYMSSAIDPCIFCFTNRELRKTLKVFFKRKYFTANHVPNENDRALKIQLRKT